MICATAINILNLKPFYFFVSDNPSPRFHQQRTPIYFLRTYDSPHGEKWMFNYGTAILYVQLYYLDVQL